MSAKKITIAIDQTAHKKLSKLAEQKEWTLRTAAKNAVNALERELSIASSSRSIVSPSP